MHAVYWTVMIFCLYINGAECGQLCVSCRDTDSLESCFQFEKCGNDQVCYLQKYRTDRYQIKYESGCTYPTVCSESVSTGSIVGKRDLSGIHILCQKCCNDTMLCNRNDLCSNPIGHQTPRQCASCSETTDPQNCTQTVTCDKDEVCFIHQYSHESAVLYSMGCKKYTLCGQNEIISTGLGKRSLHGYRLNCQHCCDDTDNCNRNLTCAYHSNVLVLFKFLVLYIENYSERAIDFVFFLGINSTGSCRMQSKSKNRTLTIQVTPGKLTGGGFGNKSMISNDQIGYRGIYFECNVPVNVYCLSTDTGSSDGFYVLPDHVLGDKYIIPTYMPSHEHHSLFSVTTRYNKTEVTIHLKTNGGSAEFNKTVFKDNEIINISISAFETFEISCQMCDLSGTYVTSSNPIAVVAGNDCLNLDTKYCSHASEMIIPVSFFSKKYILPLLESSYGGKVKIFAEYNTSITCYQAKNMTVSAKGFKELDFNDIHYIESSSPIMVMSFVKYFDNNANAFMMTIPGVDQYLNYYTFVVLSNINSSLSFIVKALESNEIRLDGKPVYSLIQKQIILNDEQYITFAVDISPGSHTAELVSGNPFGLFVYGFGNDDSYGYSAGFK